MGPVRAGIYGGTNGYIYIHHMYIILYISMYCRAAGTPAGNGMSGGRRAGGLPGGRLTGGHPDGRYSLIIYPEVR